DASSVCGPVVPLAPVPSMPAGRVDRVGRTAAVLPPVLGRIGLRLPGMGVDGLNAPLPPVLGRIGLRPPGAPAATPPALGMAGVGRVLRVAPSLVVGCTPRAWWNCTCVICTRSLELSTAVSTSLR